MPRRLRGPQAPLTVGRGSVRNVPPRIPLAATLCAEGFALLGKALTEENVRVGVSYAADRPPHPSGSSSSAAGRSLGRLGGGAADRRRDRRCRGAGQTGGGALPRTSRDRSVVLVVAQVHAA